MSEAELPNQNNNGCSEHPMDYLNKAAAACAAGDMTLGLHLYMAAYEKAMSEQGPSSGVAIPALREAWRLACFLKERSIAEHVFERLEPYLSSEEISECAEALQNLALDRLEEYGFSREELQDMAEAISQDFLGIDSSVVKVEHFSIPNVGMIGVAGQMFNDADDDTDEAPAHVDVFGAQSVDPFTQDDSPSEQAVQVEGQAEGGADQNAAPEAAWDAALENAQDAAQDSAPSVSDIPDSSDDQAHNSRRKDSEHPGVGVSPVFNPYDMYPASSEGTSWRGATNAGSGWNESIGFDGTTVLDQRFEGFARVLESTDEERTEAEAAAADAGSPAAQPSNGANEAAAQATSAAGEAAPAEAQQVSSETPAPDLDTPLTALPASVSDQTHEASKESAGQELDSTMPSMPDIPSNARDGLNYRTLVGYEDAVAIMRDYGFGLKGDRGFVSFVNMLNEQHGLSRMPAADTMLFRSAAIEDATRFVEATIGELGLPTLRMTMEEGMQGMPVLCVTTDSNNRPRMNRQQNRFQGPAILVVEDLDLWHMPPVPETTEGGMNAFVLANMTRGAREAVNLIRSAVEDPDVFVLATSTLSGEVEPFIYEVLEPLTIVDIGNPTEKERYDIWAELARNHPSMRALNLDDLTRYSAQLARCDIYVAAREAVEEAYKLGLVQRTFVPVTSQNIFDKLAAMQPLDSEEYRALEQRVINDFVSELDDLEQLLDDGQSQE